MYKSEAQMKRQKKRDNNFAIYCIWMLVKTMRNVENYRKVRKPKTGV